MLLLFLACCFAQPTMDAMSGVNCVFDINQGRECARAGCLWRSDYPPIWLKYSYFLAHFYSCQNAYPKEGANAIIDAAYTYPYEIQWLGLMPKEWLSLGNFTFGSGRVNSVTGQQIRFNGVTVYLRGKGVVRSSGYLLLDMGAGHSFSGLRFIPLTQKQEVLLSPKVALC